MNPGSDVSTISFVKYFILQNIIFYVKSYALKKISEWLIRMTHKKCILTFFPKGDGKRNCLPIPLLKTTYICSAIIAIKIKNILKSIIYKDQFLFIKRYIH